MGILPKAQQMLWGKLSPIKELDFVLYGGTAIALQIDHRESVDFDFFSSTPLNKHKLVEKCPWLSSATTIQDEPDTWTVLCGEDDSTVKVSFFGGLTIGRIGEPMATEDDVLYVAALEDLFALKLSVILKRAEAKDYIDLVALLNTGMDLSTGLAGATALYGSGFQPSESLKAMTYFEDGDLSSLTDEAKEILTQAPIKVRDLPQVLRAADTLL